MNYCVHCGGKLVGRQPAGVAWQCAKCQRYAYVNPVPTIDAMLFDESGKILLGKRRNKPYQSKLNLPGGFVDPDETLEQAIARELAEELGLQPSDYSDLTYAGSRVDRNDGRKTLAIIMTGSIEHRTFEPNDEVTAYKWINPSDLLPRSLTNLSEYNHIKAVAATLH